MDVIRGTTRPKRRHRWWTTRPALRLVRDPRAPRLPRDAHVPQSGEDVFFLAMIGSFGLFVLAFAMFIGAWNGG